MRTTVGLLLTVGLLSGICVVPGHTQPTTADLAWQAVGATAGMTAGTLVGSIAAIPGLLQYESMWDKNVCASRLSDGTVQFDLKQPTDAACMGQFVYAVSMGSSTISAGAGLGTLAGLFVVANSQDHGGSVIGATLAVVAAQAGIVTWNMTTMTQFTNDLIDDLEHMNDPDSPESTTDLQLGQWIQSSLGALLMPAAAVLGYNLP